MIQRPAHLHWLDKTAITLSGFCVVHCVATVVLIGTLSSLGHFFADPRIHEIGLLGATLLGALALGSGLLRHRQALPILAGVPGLALMAAALFVPHGYGEALLTILGVSLVAGAHLMNAWSR
tara:strand:- start:3254 stop:3619 length:366 start_codon:yes stop_codon:yes gene_type:complete